MDGEAGCSAGGWHRLRSQIPSQFRRATSSPGPPGGRRRIIGFVLLRVNGAASWGWPALLLLGAYHGINPGMGWLFAVALGMQERRRAAVAWSLVPITLGHAFAIAAAIAVAGVLGMIVSLDRLKVVVAAALFAFGGYRFIRHRHPKGGGMRVGCRD